MIIKKVILAVVILALGAFIAFSCNTKSSGEWVAKVNDDIITLDTFNSFYYAQHRLTYNESDEEIDKRAANPGEVSKNPLLNKSEFLENLIRQRLVYNKAVESGLLKNKELEALIQMAKETMVVGYFVREKFKDDIKITEEEIGKIYTKEKDRFRGVPIEQAEQYIRQQLVQQKLQVKLREFVEFLRDEGKIEKNMSLLTQKEGTSDTQKDKIKEKPSEAQ